MSSLFSAPVFSAGPFSLLFFGGSSFVRVRASVRLYPYAPALDFQSFVCSFWPFSYSSPCLYIAISHTFLCFYCFFMTPQHPQGIAPTTGRVHGEPEMRRWLCVAEIFCRGLALKRVKGMGESRKRHMAIIQGKLRGSVCQLWIPHLPALLYRCFQCPPCRILEW